jgi:UDP-N-acetylmuramoylalanine--D-glutamate ligase
MNNPKIACFGYGKTTRAIAGRVGPCTFFDDKAVESYTDEAGNTIHPSHAYSIRPNLPMRSPRPGCLPITA